MNPLKIGILTTHPIQYQVPWFRALAATPEIDLTVFYCMLPDAKQQGEGFGVSFQWDIPLLDGYRHELLKNVSRNPGVTRFLGCDTPAIKAIVRDGGFDAFIVNGWVVKSCLQLLFACRKHGVPCIVRGESNSLRPRPWWKSLLHRLLLKQYAAFLFIGKSNREFYLGNGVPAAKLFPGLYCVDNDRFIAESARLRPQRSRLREKWGIPQSNLAVAKKKEETTDYPGSRRGRHCGASTDLEDKEDGFQRKERQESEESTDLSAVAPPPLATAAKADNTDREARKNFHMGLGSSGKMSQDPVTFLFCGKFVAKKHPDHLLHATEIACAGSGANPVPLHILMVGDGALRQDCERLARENNLPVTFAGFLNQSEIIEAYVASDCLVLPSDYEETWGLVVNEAMACGIPAIVSDRGGCHLDLVVPGETGAVLPFGDHAALGELMKRLAGDPAALRAMGAKAREKVGQYSIDNLVKGTLEALRYACYGARR